LIFEGRSFSPSRQVESFLILRVTLMIHQFTHLPGGQATAIPFEAQNPQRPDLVFLWIGIFPFRRRSNLPAKGTLDDGPEGRFSAAAKIFASIKRSSRGSIVPGVGQGRRNPSTGSRKVATG
jgi:hypothetical protein